MELPDPKAQRLQQRHLQALMAIGWDIETHKFAYPFCFSRVLDVDLAKMAQADQCSIRFDTYNKQTVLEITGNYYAAYAADRMDPPARLNEMFRQVIMPILRAEVSHFPDDSEFSAFAIEVSHHVRQKEFDCEQMPHCEWLSVYRSVTGITGLGKPLSLTASKQAAETAF